MKKRVLIGLVWGVIVLTHHFVTGNPVSWIGLSAVIIPLLWNNSNDLQEGKWRLA